MSGPPLCYAKSWTESDRIRGIFLENVLLFPKGGDPQVQDMINKIDDGSASLNFGDFCLLMSEKTVEVDPETLFKDTFRVFSKDEDGEDQMEPSIQGFFHSFSFLKASINGLKRP